MTIATVLFAVALSLVPLRCGASDDGSVVLEEFAVTRGGDIIIAPVSVADKNYHFIVDTGCTSSCFNTRHKHTLGAPLGKVPGVAPGGENLMERFAAPQMRLGRIPLRSGPEVGCLDLSFVERYAGREVDGILGMDSLDRLVLNIDFDVGKVRVLSSSQNEVGRPVRIIWHQREHMREGPFLQAWIDGDLPAEFLVDTGAVRAHFGSLDVEPFDLLQSHDVIVPLPGRYTVSSTTGRTDVRFGRLRRVRIANHEHKDVIVERLQFWNTVGIGFLVRYAATFDFPASKAYLTPSRSFRSSERVDRSGLDFDRKNGEVVITKVTQGSPGAAAGINVGDALVCVDGNDIHAWSLFRLENLFYIAGPHTLSIRRKGVVINVKLAVPAIDGGAGKQDRADP